MVFYGVATFLFGVFAADSGWNIVMTVCVAILLVSPPIYFFRRAKFWRYAMVIFFAVIAGVVYHSAYIHWQAAHTHTPSGKTASFFGVVVEEPKPAGNFTMLVVELQRPYSGSMDLFISANNTAFHYGDELWIKGSITASNDPHELPVLFSPQVKAIAEHRAFWFVEVAIDVKELVVRKIAELLPSDQASILSGILVGATSAMNATLKAEMETSGTTYIVNMYGYKIAVIIAALAAILKDRVPRRALLFLTLGIIFLFVIFSGSTISAIRAAIMASFAVIARGTGRVFSARNAVAFAAFGMVIMNATILTDAAFQLSFLSFLGIYYLGPPINNYFHWIDGGVLQWKEHAMLSLSTNLAIVPVVVNTFGDFSFTSLVSNILIMIPWLALIALGVALFFLGYVSPVLAFCVGRIAGILLQYELCIIRFFAAIPLNIPHGFGSVPVIVLYYAILIVFAHYYAAPSEENN